MNAPDIDLWSERGVGHDEIRRGLWVRPEADCIAATKWLREMGQVDDELGLKIAEMAETLRNANRVLDKIEPKIRAALDGHPALPQILELHALMVEAYVRGSNHLYPERN